MTTVMHTRSSQRTTLSIRGMRCASCVGRIEKELTTLSGVSAHINIATERATIDHDETVTSGVLIEAVAKAGYEADIFVNPHSEQKDGTLKNSLSRDTAGAIICAVPVVVISMISFLQFGGFQWVTFLLASIVVLYCGRTFHVRALHGARYRSTTMDTLVSIGTLTSYVWSVWASLTGHHAYYEVACTIISLVLVGRLCEERAKHRVGIGIRELLSRKDQFVACLRKGQKTRIKVDDLRVGDEFFAYPGESIATDGVIVHGASAVDTSMMTGEPVPVEVGVRDSVIGGTLNTNGQLLIRATRVGGDTQHARIGRLIEEAQSRKAKVARFADRVARIFVPCVLGLAAATTALWWLSGIPLEEAVATGVAVIIIACPCALGIATPLALMAGISKGAQHGILIRGAETLESTQKLDVILLDKTGTLTTGKMKVLDVTFGEQVPSEAQSAALQRIGAIHDTSQHPISRAIADHIRQGHEQLSLAESVEEIPGRGVRGIVDGMTVEVGKPGLPLPQELKSAVDNAIASGKSTVVASINDVPTAVFTLGDSIRPTAAAAIVQLKELQLTPILLSGDNRVSADAVAHSLHIESVIAEVLPEEKVAVVERLRAKGKSVAMVGDGVNDAAALASANIGISMGSGTDTAIEASDITLLTGDIAQAAEAIRLARRTLQTIKQNLFWAFAYNVAAIPLAVTGFLNPMIAAGAMVCSSLFVVGNSLRLSR